MQIINENAGKESVVTWGKYLLILNSLSNYCIFNLYRHPYLGKAYSVIDVDINHSDGTLVLLYT